MTNAVAPSTTPPPTANQGGNPTPPSEDVITPEDDEMILETVLELQAFNFVQKKVKELRDEQNGY